MQTDSHTTQIYTTLREYADLRIAATDDNESQSRDFVDDT